MGSLVTATVHGTKDGKEYTGNSLEYSVKQYAYNKLKADTTDDKFKTMLVDMLNYGAAAQEYWGYNPKNLVNAELTDEQKAYLPTYANKSKPGVDGDGHWQENFAMISTWNEYGEGTYIMPSDGLHGFEYLDALREVYSGGGTHTDVKPLPSRRRSSRTTIRRIFAFCAETAMTPACSPRASRPIRRTSITIIWRICSRCTAILIIMGWLTHRPASITLTMSR